MFPAVPAASAHDRPSAVQPVSSLRKSSSDVRSVARVSIHARTAPFGAPTERAAADAALRAVLARSRLWSVSTMTRPFGHSAIVRPKWNTCRAAVAIAALGTVSPMETGSRTTSDTCRLTSRPKAPWRSYSWSSRTRNAVTSNGSTVVLAASSLCPVIHPLASSTAADLEVSFVLVPRFVVAANSDSHPAVSVSECPARPHRRPNSVTWFPRSVRSVCIDSTSEPRPSSVAS